MMDEKAVPGFGKEIKSLIYAQVHSIFLLVLFGSL